MFQGKTESKNVTFSFEPAIEFHYLNCQYANGWRKAYKLTTGSYICLLEVTDGKKCSFCKREPPLCIKS